MDLDEIRLILELMREHDVAEFELERDSVKLRLRKAAGGTWAAQMPPLPVAPYIAPVAAGPGGPAAGPATEAAQVLTAASEDMDLAIVTSPIVGTFYRSSEPGARPFVEVGQMVQRGDVLCIIEAMKLMNEIQAECDGEIVKVYFENGHAVQYGERLFAIRPV